MNLKNYNELFEQIFGQLITRDFRNGKLHSIYPENSKYFNKCYEALLNIEYQYIEELLFSLRDDGVPGIFVEFGIFQGAWIERLFHMTESAGIFDRDIYGFDSFKGLSRPDEKHDVDFWKEGMYACSRQEVEARLQTQQRPRIKLVEGFFVESLKSDQAQHIETVSFARIDCDIYEPAKQCLEYLSNRLSDKSILVFDDWTHDFQVGEGRAFAEWVATVPHLSFEFLFMGPWDHLHLRVRHRAVCE